MDKLNIALANIIMAARENLEKDGYLIPVFFIITDQEVLVVPASFDDERKKDFIADEIRRKVRENNAHCVILLSESWSVDPDRAMEFLEGQQTGKWGCLSECPFKKEVVSLSVETRTGDQMGMADIITTPDGKKTFCDFQFISGDGSTGRFTHFLGPKAASD